MRCWKLFCVGGFVGNLVAAIGVVTDVEPPNTLARLFFSAAAGMCLFAMSYDSPFSIGKR
jgi:hypothetical protein